MNIKEKIGMRIREARKVKKLTRKVLAELTEDLNISNINNYERGDRTPGPREIKQLANALDVSPAFLMCLSDEKEPQKIPGLGALIPLLNHQHLCDLQTNIKAIENELADEQIEYIPLSPGLLTQIGKNAFALRMNDESMEPELKSQDILLVDPDSEPRPNGFVLAKIMENKTVIVRRYKQLSASKQEPEFELLPNNSNWAKIVINTNNKGSILGNVRAIFRLFN